MEPTLSSPQYKRTLKSLVSPPLTFTKWQKLVIFLFEEQESPVAKFIQWSLLSLILLSAFAYVIETLPSIVQHHWEGWLAFEYICMIIFTLEYLARYVAHLSLTDPFAWHFVKEPLNVIDLLSIVCRCAPVPP